MSIVKSPVTNLTACLVLSFLVGAIIGVTDLQMTHWKGTVLVLVAAGVTLGAMYPRYAVVVGGVLGLSVPVAHAAARLRGWPVAESPVDLGWTLLALVPAVAAAFAGCALRWVITPKEAARPRPPA
jgi:hypothetical protein